MRPISQWAHLMSSVVQVAPQTGTDGYGKPSYGAAKTYQAHLSKEQRLVRSSTGQVVQSMQCVHLNTADVVLPTAQLTLSTADVGSTAEALVHPNIVAVERRFDRSAAHHTVLCL